MCPFRANIMKMNSNGGMQLLIRITTFILALFSLIAAFGYNNKASSSWSVIVIAVILILSVLLVIENISYGKHLKRTVAKLSARIKNNDKESLQNFPAPAVLIDSDEDILWVNDSFEKKLFQGSNLYGARLGSLINIDMAKVFSEEGDLVCVGGRFYNAIAVHTDRSKTISMIYFKDTTDFVELDYETRQSHKSVIVIMIDNYDDVMRNLLESEKAHTMVELEYLVENFVKDTNSISKKLSNDRFFVIMEHRYLSKIIENRFKILEDARNIKVGGNQSVTLSIGVGTCAEDLAQSERYARAALDMCLGRGGDQAAVKTDAGYEFYGGVSKGIEKNTKVKSRMMASRLAEIMLGKDKILVMGHRFGDLDSIGSAIGLVGAFKSISKEAYVVVNEDTCLAKSLIKYVEEHDISNYFITPAQALEKMTNDTLLIVVDTHNSEIVDSKDVLNAAREVVVIDHHRLMVKAIENTALFFHEPNCSSACEMVTELLQYLDNGIKISPLQAEALLSGIMLDTKNFIMRTGVKTFEAAAYLKSMGADTVAVKKLFANSIETYQEKSALITKAEIYRKCAVSCTTEVFSNIRIAASQAADEMLGITGVNAAFVIYGDDKNANISARSMGAYNVQVIMESMGGGGHQTMAATQLETSVEDAKKQLFEAIDEYIRNNS